MDVSHQKTAECAKAIAIAAAKAMSVDGKVNLPSMIAGCARLSGSYMIGTLGLNLAQIPEGQAVLHASAEAATSTLINFCASILGSLGSKVPAEPPADFGELRAKIQMDYVKTQSLLRGPIAPLQSQFQLTDAQMAKAASGATAILVHQFAKYMEPGSGFGIAVYGFTEGVRTAPGAPGVPVGSP